MAEAAAPVASIGNSQYFWWVFMMIAFLLPYGMISSELGTTYTGDGGLYDWIHAAYPNGKWAARASWYYWINFPLWMASLAVVCPELLSVLTGLSFGWLAKLLIELAFIWIVTWIAFYPVCDSIIILNISAAIKMILALTVGVLGIVYVVKNGFVNDMAFRTFLPGFDLHSLSYISVIIFNFLGFEVVCTYADNMRDPKRQLPQAIVTGGIVTVKDLLLAEDDTVIENLMDTNVIFATTTEDQESVAEKISDYDLMAIPVVDLEGRLVGIVTVDDVIDVMEEFGDECKRRHGKRIIYPSDEWYLKAGRPIPAPEFYEDYDQLENGVGMMSLFRQEFLAELEKPHRIYGTKKMDVVTGTMAAPLITEMMDELRRQYPMIEVKVHPIKNNFFGGNVGVAGLVTATDIIAQCEGRLSSGTLGVPAVMLREEKDTFLDDMTIEQLGQRLGVKVEVLPVSGGDEAKALLRSGLHIARRRRP